MTGRKLRIGVAGLGRAFVLMQPALAHHPKIQLVAAADPRKDARARFSAEFQGRSFESVEALCADANVDAVYIATPHQFHAQNAITAARHGKHVLVEKPMALNLDECHAISKPRGEPAFNSSWGTVTASMHRLRAHAN